MYTYYRFIDKFHVEPRSWEELMEFGNFIEVENKIQKLVSDTMKKENNNG